MCRMTSSRHMKLSKMKNKNISNPFSIKLNYLKALVREARGFFFNSNKIIENGNSLILAPV
jgi:hypothetical protein